MAILKEYRGLYPKVGNNVYLADNVVLVGDVTIEDDCSIWWGAVLRGDCGALHIGRGSNIQDGSVLHVTHASDYNPAGHPRSSLRRVGYRLEEQSLIRYAWSVLDRAQNTEPLEQPLLDGVTDIGTRYLDEGKEWQDSWPPASFTAAATRRSELPSRSTGLTALPSTFE